MDIAAVRCTRSEFHYCVTRLSKATAWELRSRHDALGSAIDWLEATYPLPTTGASSDACVLVTVYIVYHPDFCVPQLGFFTSSLLCVEDVCRALPNLAFTNAGVEVRGEEGTEGAVAARPLVSCAWNEDARQHMWLVHPCDTEKLLRCCRYDGVQGDLVTVFVHAMLPYFPFAPALLPPL